ncbi:lysophospholipase [Sneathiella marina]|uniref:Lysophospholipase n=1 Tax=Sneathiella marina TaxID=2950108 RepID=A0ABY4W626_9PROT|nr:alpha/beta fold hydrolase [Sneathiella marina]USG60101.1 lysophospholipase [Sneathiella marina]
MIRATKFLAVIVVIFGILPFAAMYFLQAKMIFPAPDLVPPAGPQGDFDAVRITTEDGETLRAYEHRAETGEATILVFHGNADAAFYQISKGEKLAAAGFGVLLVEYRGYGGSTGSPTEAGLIRDGLASYDHVRRQSDQPIGLYAHSLGTGVAVPVAVQRPVFAVALEAPFTSILDVARYRMGWVPLDGLLKHPFHSDQLIGQITAPIQIIHGTADRVIPFKLGKRLAELAPKGTKFLAIDGAGHNNLAAFGSIEIAIAFFKEALAER